MILLRNAYHGAKCFSNCGIASQATFNVVRFIGLVYCRPRKKYSLAGSECCRGLSNVSAGNLVVRRWNSGMLSGESAMALDKYGFHTSADNEIDSLELATTSDVQEVEDKEEEIELYLSEAQLRRRKREFRRKVPVGEEVIHALQTMFGMTRHNALITLRSPKFFLVADAAVLKTLHRLRDYKIPAEQIQRSPWILFQPSKEIAEKVRMLTEPYLFYSHFDGLGFCFFSPYWIEQYQELFEAEWEAFPNHRNRIYYMAEHLRVPVDHLTEKVVKAYRILAMDFRRIELYIELLNRYEIHREDILNDMWIFFNNIDLAERRLRMIIDAGCERPKLWMCRCPEEVFAKTMNRYQSRKEVLGSCSSLEEYLTKRLECTQEEINFQIDYNDSFRKMSLLKVQRVLDLLLSEGFTKNQIKRSLRLLRYSEDRTAMRIKRLKGLGVPTITTSILYKSPYAFEAYCDMMMGHEDQTK